MIVRVPLDLTDEQVARLATLACMRGFHRVDPKKAWSTRDSKDAVRYVVSVLIMDRMK